MMSGTLYCELQKSIKETEMSARHREEMVRVCSFLVEQEAQYRANLESVFDRFLSAKETDIKHGFESISAAMRDGRSIQPGLQRIGDACGLRLRFANLGELERQLGSGEALKL
jgi:hypothetical protein